MSGRPLATHKVTNQSPPFCDFNLFQSDAVLHEAVLREGAAYAVDELTQFGEIAGSARGFEIGRLANENPPKLRRFTADGFPADLVEFHPAYHEAMAMSFSQGLHASAWEHLVTGAEPQAGRHVARLAGIYMMTQMEPGHICPITMTSAAVPALLRQPGIAEQWLPKITSRTYDPAFKPMPEKASVTLGMGMTEKQGGTDVRANTTKAVRAQGGGGVGAEYILSGHKWFMSAPMCDAFLMLAQARGGLSCFLVPRFLPDGTVNGLRFERLKEKLGNRSNASSEVELTDARGWLIGEEGRGVATIIEMVTMTRLDCAVASAGQMRLALAVATHHCRYRSVFQARLVDHPLMRAVLADMALDVEAATVLSFRLARAFDRAEESEVDAAWRRVMTPVSKYFACKMAPAVGYEAMECLGGNGYVEEGLAARLYREMPLNAIWEGSGNVMALDLLRVLSRDADALTSALDQIEGAGASDKPVRDALAKLRQQAGDTKLSEGRARWFVVQLATVACAGLLRAHAPAFVADAYISTRLGSGGAHSYGAHGVSIDEQQLIDRILPA